MIRKKYKNYKNLNYNRITRMRMMIMKRIISKKLRMIIRVNIIITTTMKTMRVPGKNDNENDQSNDSNRSKLNSSNKVKNN